MTIRLVPEHRNNLRIETVLSVVFNTIISGAFAWGMFHGEDIVPLWGSRGIAVDLVPTVFMITLVLTIVLTKITRRRLRRGKLPAPSWNRTDLPLVGWLPENVLLRALALAAVLTLVLVPLSVLILAQLGVEQMGFGVFFVFKLAYGALFALIVTPAILLRALADAAHTKDRKELNDYVES